MLERLKICCNVSDNRISMKVIIGMLFKVQFGGLTMGLDFGLQKLVSL